VNMLQGVKLIVPEHAVSNPASDTLTVTSPETPSTE